MNKEYSLYLFDVDGTLIERDSGIILTGVKERFALLARRKPRIALISNQGGVGLRHWMFMGNFGDPWQFPTAQEVRQKHLSLARKLVTWEEADVFQAYAYQSKKTREWSPTPLYLENFGPWLPEWRKPSPGMLLEAMKNAEVSPAKTVMIGDSPEDFEAAKAAGVDFVWAYEFFGREEDVVSG